MTSTAMQASPEPCVPSRTLGMMIPHQVGPKPNAQAIKQGGCEKSWFMTGCLSHGGSLKYLQKVNAKCPQIFDEKKSFASLINNFYF